MPFNTATGTVGKAIRAAPRGFMGAITDMAITPNGTTLYVSVATFLNTVIPISTRTGRAGKPIRLSRDGMLVMGGENIIRITPDGKTAYAAYANTEVPIDIATNIAGRPIRQLGDPAAGGVRQGPYNMAITPDGQTAYVLLEQSGLALINTATNQVRKRIDIGKQPAGIAITPDGKTVYVANRGSGTVTVIDTRTKVVEKTIKVGKEPWDVLVTP